MLLYQANLIYPLKTSTPLPEAVGYVYFGEIAQSKRARAGSLTIVDYPQLYKYPPGVWVADVMLFFSGFTFVFCFVWSRFRLFASFFCLKKNLNESKPPNQSKGVYVGTLAVGTKALHYIKRVPPM